MNRILEFFTDYQTKGVMRRLLKLFGWPILIIFAPYSVGYWTPRVVPEYDTNLGDWANGFVWLVGVGIALFIILFIYHLLELLYTWVRDGS